MHGQTQHNTRRRGHKGQMTVLLALTLTIFIGGMVLGIDMSRLRAEAESAQQAANAAALAGVVFLPQFPGSAYTRAISEAKKNGYYASSGNGISISAQTVSNYPNRLQVTITDTVPTIFGKVLGLGPMVISRSAIAEFAEPVQMGAPDYVLGYAPFPTSLVTTTGATQGFYLEARGPYGQQENGDAYSQYFESYSGYGLNPAGASNPYYSTMTDPCTGAPPAQCSGLQPNPDRQAIGFQGYDFVVDNPSTNTLVIKLFDPFDEGPFDSYSNSSQRPSQQPLGTVYNNRYIDQFGCSVGNTHICANGSIPVALHFTLSGPYQTTYDTSSKPVPSLTTGGTCANDCVLSNNPGDGSFVAGDDPTYEDCSYYHVTYTSCNATGTNAVSPYAYKFLNYAIIHHPGLYRIHVVSGMNTYGLYNGKYGTGGNVFGIAVCGDSSPYLGTVNMTSTNSLATYSGHATVADPTSGGNNPAWNASSCVNPNTLPGMPAACANPGTVTSDSCVHVYAEDRMCVYNNLTSSSTSSTSALVPLGFVPPAYAGKTLHVRLYDVGDISGPTANNSVQVLTPAGDLTYNSGNPNRSVGSLSFPAVLTATWSAAPTDPGSVVTNYSSSSYGKGSGYVQAATQTYGPTQPVDQLGAASGKYNGSWLSIDVPIPAHNASGTGYDQMVQYFGGYWKMMYTIGQNSAGNDTTTWEISVNGSPVHLVSGT